MSNLTRSKNAQDFYCVSKSLASKALSALSAGQALSHLNDACISAYSTHNCEHDEDLSSRVNMRNVLWPFIFFLLLLLLLLGGYKLKQRNLVVNVSAIALDETCDLRNGPCTSQIPGGGSVTLSITPENIPLLKPLRLEVSTSGIQASQVEIDIVGIGMEMGYNHAILNASNDSLFNGEIILPVCIRTKMDWEARVSIVGRNQKLLVPYRFYTQR